MSSATTDAAAVFSVLRSKGAGLRGGIQPTLELESGANDPMAVFLTVGLLEVVTGEADSWTSLGVLLVQQVLVGTAVGLVGGWVGQQLLNRLGLGFDRLYPVLALSVGISTYAGAAVLGGSGFLAIYLAGLWLGNRQLLHRNSVLRFHDAIAWLSQIGMFLVLGLLVFPSRLPEVAGPATIVVVALVLVARPLGTLVALTPFGDPLRDQAVVAWVGLRGATPIILATFPLVDSIPESQLIFDVVFFVVLISVLVHGTTVGRVADLLGATTTVALRRASPLEAGQPLADDDVFATVQATLTGTGA